MEFDINNLPEGARVASVSKHTDNDAQPITSFSPEQPKLSFVNKVKSFALAMASAALQAKTSRAQRRARLATCAECKFFKPTNDYRIGFCGACGCGQTKVSTLAFKSAILRSTCPQLLWDKVLSLPILPTNSSTPPASEA